MTNTQMPLNITVLTPQIYENEAAMHDIVRQTDYPESAFHNGSLRRFKYFIHTYKL
jgi:hypothetical protein